LRNGLDSELLASALASCMPLISVVVGSAHVGVIVVGVVVAKVVLGCKAEQTEKPECDAQW